MAAPSLAPVLDSASRRRFLRYPINVSLEVIALQSGIPNNMPGRCTDLSEAGLGAVVAGELIAGQAVAIELRLPNVGLPVRARAQVRYQERLRCGLQFVGLTVEQREKIRYWSSVNSHSVPANSGETEIVSPDPPLMAAVPDKQKRARWLHARRRLIVLIVLMAALAVFGWWQWQKAWSDLEGDTSLISEAQPGQPLRVPPEIMDRQIIYKVEPAYPDAARQAGIQGFVVLDAVIAPDGTVKHSRPVAGPELLSQSALDAVQSWRYTPYRVEGRPVEVATTISVDFRLR